uniref:Gamma-secretase subunit PEN-2 n=1 Tax=Clastoptera arizonana TaxID=38151 RepID=A0A1B6CTQ4_9HEMI
MDLSKMNTEQKLSLCQWYYRAGYFGLPIVWLVNAIWFFEEAFKTPTFEGQKTIQKYVILSGMGAALWAIIIAVWVYIFQTHRVQWADFGDQLSFIIPTGIK